jgi:hypothetical protein
MPVLYSPLLDIVYWHARDIWDVVGRVRFSVSGLCTHGEMDITRDYGSRVPGSNPGGCT